MSFSTSTGWPVIENDRYCQCFTASTATDSSSGGQLRAFTEATSPVLSMTVRKTIVPSRRTILASSGYSGATFMTSSPSAFEILTGLPFGAALRVSFDAVEAMRREEAAASGFGGAKLIRRDFRGQCA